MKDYKQMSDSVIQRVNEHRERQKVIKKRIQKAVLSVSCLCVVMAIIVVISTENWKLKPEHKVTEQGAKISNVMEMEENTKTTEKTKTTAKSTTKKAEEKEEEETSDEDNTDSEEDTELDEEANGDAGNNIPTVFTSPEKMIYYYDGVFGNYPLTYASVLTFELANPSMNEWVELPNTELIQETTDGIKEKDRAVEFIYTAEQTIQITLFDGSTRAYTFDKILFVLSGEHQQTLFFGYNDTYLPNPIRTTTLLSVNDALAFYHQELIEEITTTEPIKEEVQ